MNWGEITGHHKGIFQKSTDLYARQSAKNVKLYDL